MYPKRSYYVYITKKVVEIKTKIVIKKCDHNFLLLKHQGQLQSI